MSTCRSRPILGLLFTLCATAAQARDLGPMVTDAPVNWATGTLRLGDAEARVRRIADAQPDRRVILYEAERFPVGEQWMFIGRGNEAGRILWLDFHRGRVTRVWTEPFGEDP